jgi:phosphocarrier protein HPr
MASETYTTFERTIEVMNKLGLHARPAAQLVQTAKKFASKITLIKDGQEVDGKSIMGVMMLAAGKGSTVTIRASGKDAEQALSVLVDLINTRFGEE